MKWTLRNLTTLQKTLQHIMYRCINGIACPQSVHKILMHGSQVILHNILVPIDALSEEAQEARNKDYKRFRQYHTRKMSRMLTTHDLMHVLLVSSDPVISELRSFKKLSTHAMTKEALGLLKTADADSDSNDDIASDDDNDDFFA